MNNTDLPDIREEIYEYNTRHHTIRITPNFKENIFYDDILEVIKKIYHVCIIKNESEVSDKKTENIFVIPPIKGGRAFDICIRDSFVKNNNAGILDLLKKLILENYVYFIRGTFSYVQDNTYFFLNLSTVITDSEDFERNITLMYDKITCLFKHKIENVIFLFSETKSPYLAQKYTKKLVEMYKLIGIKNKKQLVFDAVVLKSKNENVMIIFAHRKPSIFSKEIYGVTIQEGMNILQKELKNLGFEMVRFEKLQEWSYGA